MSFSFSIIIPVYNRPQELDELLRSLSKQNYKKPFEVIVVEDGSEIPSEEICFEFDNHLNINYLTKKNSGPGLSRNFGANHAKGNYLIFLDSDCIVPNSYLKEVEHQLQENYTDAFGGRDQSHSSFSTLQKAINYSMTSLFTTGGIRGNKKTVGRFQPRSFNMGVSKIVFEKLNGFGSMRVGEDVDLTLRIWKAGFQTQLIKNAAVFHKRRTTMIAFIKQTYAFGKGRACLNKIHPETRKITYWFPSIFILTFLIVALVACFQNYLFLLLYAVYLSIILFDATLKNQSLKVGFLSLATTICQFSGYGVGFMRGNFFSKKAND